MKISRLQTLLQKKRVLFASVVLACLAAASCYLIDPTHKRARAAVLKHDLSVMREALHNYTLDNQQPPHSLQDLVDANYLRELPADPFTRRKDWTPVIGDVELSSKSTARGVIDVHSSSAETIEGARVNSW
jgi:general secretion pathway protein G